MRQEEEIMDNFKNHNNKYFQDALSDFVYDAASGRAIRHLIDAGYTAAQIMRELDYPTPFEKIQHTVTRYLKETGILLEELPVTPTNLHTIQLNDMPQDELFSLLAQQVASNGEENSYVSCSFGFACKQASSKTVQALSMLTTREQDYLNGIEWEKKIMYHRLNRRMLEIGVQIAMWVDETSFYFLKNGDIFHLIKIGS